jgi:protein phosphatase
MPRLEYAALTEQGLDRQVNQDRMFAKAGNVSGSECGLFCVADGMGGLHEGHYAASAAVDTIGKWWDDSLPEIVARSESPIENGAFGTLFLSVNDIILEHAREENVMIGTTCSMLLICNNVAYIAHAGDSRIYATQKRLFRRNRIVKLTEDHNWRTDRLKEGLLSKEEIYNHPKSHMLTSCLGVFDNPRIFMHTGVIERESVFILCSDGVYNLVNAQELAKIAARYSKCEKMLEKLMQITQSRNASDDASAVAVRWA